MSMANLLHMNQLDAFKDYLTRHGIRHRPPRGDYQVLQVCKHGNQWHALYQRLAATEHLTVPRPLMGLVLNFLKEKKRDHA